MTVVTGQVLGVEQVTARLAYGGAAARAHVRKVVTELGVELQAKIKAEYLTGQSLAVRTGRLRRSINLAVESDATSATATVGTNVEYGRFWELGFDGVEQVRAHARRTLSGVLAQVRAHAREVHQQPRPFLQPALADMRARVLDRLAGVVGEGT